MNSLEQVEDNCNTFQDFKPLTKSEYEVIDGVRDIIESNTAIACTACEYCTHDCPKQIPIPRYFSLFNSAERTTGSYSSQNVYYNNIVQAGAGKASDCIKCGLCEKACPQHLPIRRYLEQVATKFENTSLPSRK